MLKVKIPIFQKRVLSHKCALKLLRIIFVQKIIFDEVYTYFLLILDINPVVNLRVRYVKGGPNDLPHSSSSVV